MIIVQCTDADRNALASMKVRAKDLQDDGTNYDGVTINKPWGKEHQFYKSDSMSFWRLQLKPESETSMHCHPGKRTVLILEDGDAILYTLTFQHILRRGEFVHIEPGAFHRTRTNHGATLVELESPANKRDLVRYNDRYGRQGKGYERAPS